MLDYILLIMGLAMVTMLIHLKSCDIGKDKELNYLKTELRALSTELKAVDYKLDKNRTETKDLYVELIKLRDQSEGLSNTLREHEDKYVSLHTMLERLGEGVVAVNHALLENTKKDRFAEDRFNELQHELTGVNSRLRERDKDKAAMAEAVAYLDTKVTGMEKKISAGYHSLNNTSVQIATLGRDVAALSRELNQVKTNCANRFIVPTERTNTGVK